MTMPASTAASAPNPPKKHRQTRIPEHLKAVKKGTSSSSSSASSSSSSSLKSSLARALRASSPRKSESASSAAAAPALEGQAHRSQNNGHALTPTASMDDVINAQMSTFSPGYPVQHQQQFGMSATSARPAPMTSPHALQQSPVRPVMATQASIHSINGTPSPSSARLPYSLTNERANELAASVERSSSEQHGFPGIPMQQQQPRQSISSGPSTSTSPMAQDSTLLARSCSSASSMAYSQPDFAFSVAAPSSSSQSLSSMSSAFTQPSVMDSSSSYQQMAIWPPPSFSNTNQIGTIPYVQSPSPLKTSESNASLSSLPNQIPLEMRQKVPTRTKRSSTTLSGMSGSSTSSSSQARLSSSSASVSEKQTSPKSPATPFSASLILSVSSDGKARLTTPQKAQKTNEMFWGSNNSTPKPTVANSAAMLRSSTTANPKTPLRPAMIRSITTDPRMSSQKREVSELNGVGRVVGQGKMFDLHGSDKDGMSFSTSRQIATMPQALNLDIEMDLAAGMGTPGQATSYSQVNYPYAAFPPQGAILTPPQSAEMGKQALPTGGKKQPFYPEKERFQSSWKFPSGMGLNLHTAGHGKVQGPLSASTTSSPASTFQSSFPSMHSLNASIANVAKGGDLPSGLASSPVGMSPVNPASEDLSRRQSRIQAWLDSPDLQDGDDTGASSWSSLPERSDQDTGSAPPTASTSSGGFSISPASIMTRTASELQVSSTSGSEEYEEFEVMRASGKSIHPLKVSKKRRLEGEEDGNVGLSSKDRDAIKAGLGMPFQAMSASSRQVTPTPDGSSPGKRNKLAKDDEASSSPNKNGTEGKGRKSGRRTKKKGTNVCSCGTGDDGNPMIQCDDCRGWFHLTCVGVEEDEIPERWFCTSCVDATAAVEQVAIGAAGKPSPVSPTHAQLAPSPIIQQTPKRPGLTREPTFSKTATPKVESARTFEDAHLVPAPSVRPVSIPSTPQSNPINFTPGHSHNASLSRAYAPVTPKVGFTSSASGHASAPGTNYQWDTYSPHTPSSSIAHSRRLSRQHLTAPSSTNWSQFSSSQWEDLPSSLPRRADESERMKQWDQFYNAPPPASINPIPMTPPLASHAAFPTSESFLPHFDQEASVSQRFLAIHSTPSNWTDTSRFPNNVW